LKLFKNFKPRENYIAHAPELLRSADISHVVI